jgi:multidrug efflux pump subunit AcrA (membrane-fusion protein)
MNVLRWVLFGFLAVLAVVSVGTYVGSRYAQTSGAKPAAQALYHCPMHPEYTSDRPGDCPICGMSLTRIKAKDATGGAVTGMGDVPGLTTVHIAPDRIQRIGVRTARIERAPSSGSLDLVGFVTPDESRLRRVQIRVSGWIRELYVSETGASVKAGQPLLSIYSPELFQSEQEYLIQRGVEALAPGGANPASERLRLLGVPDEEIRRLDREGKAATELVLRSPVSGTVLERGVVAGQSVGADTPLLTVADLSRVWVTADLYEMDMGRARVGDAARFTTDALPGRVFDGRLEFVSPTVARDTRTLKARMTLANPDGTLRPGTFGRVRVASHGASALWAPTEAVVDAGEHRYVFLARADGHFEPRMVWTGTSEGERIAILKGVAEGDTVVSSASFLIDSESRLRAAIAGMGAQPGAGHDHGGGK